MATKAKGRKRKKSTCTCQKVTIERNGRTINALLFDGVDLPNDFDIMHNAVREGVKKEGCLKEFMEEYDLPPEYPYL